MTVDQGRLKEFLGRMLADLGGAYGVALVRMGERLGLYAAMKDGVPVTVAELAVRTGLAERYVREWLAHHAASGYIEYEPASGRFTLAPERLIAESKGQMKVRPDHKVVLLRETKTPVERLKTARKLMGELAQLAA